MSQTHDNIDALGLNIEESRPNQKTMTTDSEIRELWHRELNKSRSPLTARIIPTERADEAAIRLARHYEEKGLTAFSTNTGSQW